MLRYTILWIALALVAGCGTSNTPPAAETSSNAVVDPHDVPITEADVAMPANYAEALPRIVEYRDTIREKIAAGTPTHAHRALDELDIVLGKLPSIAKDSGIPAEQWETINVSAQDLRAQFDKLHAAIDAGTEPDYAAVAKPIDEGIARLQQVQP